MTKKNIRNICNKDVAKHSESKCKLDSEVSSLGDSILGSNSKIPNITSIEKQVLKCIIGQDAQVRQIITSIYRAIYLNSIKANVLIIGSSGSGKTETIKQIAKRLHIPYTIEDATKYTKEGYHGADVNDMLYNLLEKANNDLEKAQHGIIVIDEIDKKVGHNRDDISGTDVLKSLLKIIEGTKIKIPAVDDLFGDEFVEFDTKNVIIIFSGAFSGLDKIRDMRTNGSSLGFASTDTSNTEKEKSRYTKHDLIEYGMPKEFAARIDTIIEMNKLDKKDLALILKESKLSIFKRYQSGLKKLGISLSYSNRIFERVAEESLTLNTGARELSNTVNYMFEKILYDVLSNPNEHKTCLLDLDIVQDNTKYTLS